jgi:hypothetical protein
VTLYIIIGRTHRFRDSRVVIGKFKDLSRELQDVFVAEKIRRGVRRREQEVYVFRAVENDPLAWFFVSFDIKAPKKPGYEYTVIMREMFFNLCARVDRSTYICPEEVDADSILERVRVKEANKETYYVAPNDERAASYLREAIVSGVSISEGEPPKSPLSYIRLALTEMILSVRKADRRANRVREYAEQLLARARGVLELVRRCRAKFTAIGVDPSQIELEIEGLVKTLEAAIKEKWGGDRG